MVTNLTNTYWKLYNFELEEPGSYAEIDWTSEVHLNGCACTSFDGLGQSGWDWPFTHIHYEKWYQDENEWLITSGESEFFYSSNYGWGYFPNGKNSSGYDYDPTDWWNHKWGYFIHIIDGDDVENEEFITWLENNARQIGPFSVYQYDSNDNVIGVVDHFIGNGNYDDPKYMGVYLDTSNQVLPGTLDVRVDTDWFNGIDPSDATASAADIREGETAYIATGKTTGTMPDVTPTFNGGGVNPTSATITITSSRATVSSTNTSGVTISPGVELSFERSSVTYGSTVTGYIDKANDTVALSATSATFSVDTRYTGQTFYINGVTVPSGKTFTIDNNGTVDINGGNANRGVQVNGKVAIVDQYTVTDNNGDLLVPTYNTTTYEIVYPSAFSVGSATQQGTLSGNVTSINGAIIEDSEAVHGSGSVGTSISYNLAKISSAKVLANGAKVTYSGSTPSNPSTGDIWLQIIS